MLGMALPSKKQQVAAVMRFLDSDRNEGRSLEEIAADIVDGYLEALVKDLKKPATPLRSGMLVKSPIDAKVRRIAWLDDQRGRLWVVGETSSYGWLSSSEAMIWEYCEEFRPSKMVETGEVVNGKPKKTRVEMTDEDIAEAWSNPDWQVGDQFSQHQREFKYEVIATGPQCVLMRDLKTDQLQADSNACLEKYYKREVKGLDSEW